MQFDTISEKREYEKTRRNCLFLADLYGIQKQLTSYIKSGERDFLGYGLHGSFYISCKGWKNIFDKVQMQLYQEIHKMHPEMLVQKKQKSVEIQEVRDERDDNQVLWENVFDCGLGQLCDFSEL